jgi:hypothetical protein
MKIRFFLSSSSEQIQIAKALEANLENEGFEATLWSRETHGGSQYNLEGLLDQAKKSDFAIFVFTPDDQVTIRSELFSVVRDNVLFELGLFMGTIGRDRCFMVQSTEQPMRLPPDLEGINSFKYDPKRSDGNLRRALGPITTSITERTRIVAKAALLDFTLNELKLLESCLYPSMPSNQAAKTFGSMPSAWDDKLCMRFLHLLEEGLIKRAGGTEVERTSSGHILCETAEFKERVKTAGQ